MSDPSSYSVADRPRRAGRGTALGVREHRPSTAVLACSDARVSPVSILDRASGEVFVVRIAGNAASPAAEASLVYAVDQLGVELVIVLGHTHCGAVAAAMSGTCDGPLAPIVAPICRIATSHAGRSPREIERLNVAQTIADLTRDGGLLAEAVASGRLTIRGAVFDIESGETRDVDSPRPADCGEPSSPVRNPPLRKRRPTS